jgi:hypothetical protein
MAISVSAGQAINGSFDVTLYVYGILWGENSWETVDTNALKMTLLAYNCTVGVARLWSKPFIIETKASYCTLYWAFFSGNTVPPDWWITFGVSAYLRNE